MLVTKKKKTITTTNDNNNNNNNKRELQEGWFECCSPDGFVYFFHPETGYLQ